VLEKRLLKRTKSLRTEVTIGSLEVLRLLHPTPNQTDQTRENGTGGHENSIRRMINACRELVRKL
jgi:hypothetical protein